MDKETRDNLEWYCAEARCYIEGIEDQAIFDKLLTEAKRMTDEELEREADWLDEVAGK